MGLSSITQRGFSPGKSFGWLNLTRRYLKSLTSQGITLPSYGVQLQWDNWFRALSPRGDVSATLPPRNVAAYYPNDPSAIQRDGSSNVTLWEDKSGNSPANCLCLNGVAGNYASAPDAAFATTQIEIVARIASNSWTPASINYITTKDNTGVQRSMALSIAATTGVLTLRLSADGSAMVTAVSSVAPSFSAFQTGWIKATWRASDNRVQFFTASDSASEPTAGFVQLGTDQSIAIASIFDSTSILEFGTNGTGTGFPFSGRLYYVGIRYTIGGALAYDVPFTSAAKLATSFVCPTGQTVTINTSGDTGARISGERDLYQGTAANRPAYTAAAGANRLFMTFDGTNDYMKAAPFTLSQPTSVYFVGNQITWVNGDYLYAGNTVDTLGCYQVTTSPRININAGSAACIVNEFLLGVPGILCAIFNGASSALRLNRVITSSGSPGTAAAGGFMLGSRDSTTSFGNFRVSEIVIYSEASSPATQTQIINYLASKYSIGL